MRTLNPVRSGDATTQRGVAAVEFALVLIFLLLVVAGIIEFGRAFWYLDAMTRATRDGARYLSSVQANQIGSVGVPTAQALVVSEANASWLSPPLTTGQVSVTCNPGSCQDVTAGSGVKPVYVTVAITGYAITVGGMIPFFSPAYNGSASYTGVLAPSTTMRYME